MFFKHRRELMIVVSIVAIAAFFRFYQLDVTPPGLWPDEAANGVDALKALDENDLRIFYPANNGREGLFINIQAFSIKLFGATPFALRVVSAIFGTLTVLGLYLLTKQIFNWRLASISGFFLAISFWHVNFSRIGFRAIMLPFILVWAFYFLWRGLRNNQLKEFFIAGLIGGMGFYTYFSFRIAPLIAIILFWNYWSYLKKDFDHSKYEYAKIKLLQGFALMMLTVIVTAMPMAYYFYSHPEDFLKREGRPISVFAQDEPLKEFSLSIVKTLAMFNFNGDYNQRHNIPGSAQLALPIGLLFLVGFIREFTHWIRRKHGHFSPIHTFLFSWFFIMLLPGFLSTEAPHALRTIGVIPVAMIFAGQGFWWLISLIFRTHRLTDPHFYADKPVYMRESRAFIGLTILISLASLGFFEYSRYFNNWANEPGLKEAFTQRYVYISDYLNNDKSAGSKYILVNEGDVLVDGVPNNAQTIKFLTRTHSLACSDEKKIYYIRNDQLGTFAFPKKFDLIPLADEPDLPSMLFQKFGLRPVKQNSFYTYVK